MLCNFIVFLKLTYNKSWFHAQRTVINVFYMNTLPHQNLRFKGPVCPKNENPVIIYLPLPVFLHIWHSVVIIINYN